ncbi:MAG: hypothetical protein JXR58_01370 [Bacteroidales bacterium]|nr:hypothetical protein [Bacteroidales bacterium]
MENILKAPIDQISLPEELKEIFVKAGFKNLKQVLDRKTSFLLKIKGFEYMQLKSFMDFIELHQLEDHLKDG